MRPPCVQRILVKIEEHTTVVWCGRSLGDCTVSRLDFSKCRQHEFFCADDTVCAVGYPLGATSVTLTRGVVSNVKIGDLSLTDLQEGQLMVQVSTFLVAS